MKYALFLLFLVLTSHLFGQVKLKKQEEEKILATCNSYLLEDRLWFADLSYPDSTLRKVCDDTLFLLIEIAREEVFLMEYNLISRNDTTYELVNNDSVLACKVRLEERAYFLNIERYEENWKVVSHNNQEITQATLESARNHLDSIREVAMERTRIKETTTEFIGFWNELNYADSSENLKRITTEYMYRHLILSRQLDQLEGWGKKRDLELKEITDIEIVSSDSATCRAVIVRNGGTRFNLKKLNGNWVIVGENGGTKTIEDVKKLEDRIANYKTGLEIQNSITEFNTALELYFQKNDSLLLTPLASEAVMDYLHYFKLKYQGINPEFIQVGGCRIGQYDVNKIKVEQEKAIYCSNNFCVNFELEHEKWKIVSFNGLINEPNTGKQVELEFFDFAQFFRIFYAYYIFNESDDNVVEAIEFIPSDEDYDRKIYSMLETVDSPALYPSGMDSLINLLSGTDQSGTFYYVSFVIEIDGSMAAIEFLTPDLSEKRRKEILDRLNKMETWEPAKKYKTIVRSRMIIGCYS